MTTKIWTIDERRCRWANWKMVTTSRGSNSAENDSSNCENCRSITNTRSSARTAPSMCSSVTTPPTAMSPIPLTSFVEGSRVSGNLPTFLVQGDQRDAILLVKRSKLIDSSSNYLLRYSPRTGQQVGLFECAARRGHTV